MELTKGQVFKNTKKYKNSSVPNVMVEFQGPQHWPMVCAFNGNLTLTVDYPDGRFVAVSDAPVNVTPYGDNTDKPFTIPANTNFGLAINLKDFEKLLGSAFEEMSEDGETPKKKEENGKKALVITGVVLAVIAGAYLYLKKS